VTVSDQYDLRRHHPAFCPRSFHDGIAIVPGTPALDDNHINGHQFNFNKVRVIDINRLCDDGGL